MRPGTEEHRAARAIVTVETLNPRPNVKAHRLHREISMIARPIRIILAASVVLTVTTHAWGQATAPAPPPAREGKAEFALVTTSGNAKARTIGTSGEITLRPPSWVLLGKVGFVRQEADGVVSAKSLATLERLSRVLSPRLQAFGQHAYLRDLFAGVENRNSADGGLSYLLIQVGAHTLFVDGSLGYLNEDRTVEPGLSNPIAGAGSRYKFKLSETSDLTDDLAASFDLAEDGTWRLNHLIALTARIASAFSLKVSNQLRFVDEPVPGFERTDTITSAALVVGF
jgi:putative salt-induced outer membrane protein YdiY